jgi:serine/threonine protein kinase
MHCELKGTAVHAYAGPRCVRAVCDLLTSAAPPPPALLPRTPQPQNVLLDRNGRAKIGDFGISRWEGAGGRRATGRAPPARAEHAPGPCLPKALRRRLPPTTPRSNAPMPPPPRFKDPHRSYLSVTHAGGTPNYMAPELFNGSRWV